MDSRKLRYIQSNLNFFLSTTIPPHSYSFNCHPGDEQWACYRSQLQEQSQGTTKMKNEGFIPDCSGRAFYSVQISLSHIQHLVLHCDVAGIEETAVRRTGNTGYGNRITGRDTRLSVLGSVRLAQQHCFRSLASSLMS